MTAKSEQSSKITSRASDSHSKNALRAWLQLLKCSKRMEQLTNGKFDTNYNSSLTRFDVLANLDLVPEHSVSTIQLAKMLIASKGNITRLLDRMEDDQLVSRKPNQNDRRVSDILLTLKGEVLFEQMADDHEIWVDDIFSILTNQETKQLINILNKLRSRLDETLS